MADEVVDTGVETGKPDGATPPTKTGTADPKTPDTSLSPASDVARKAEDERNRGILADLQKERKSRQEFERQVTAAKAELEQERRRVRALSGVEPRSAQDADNDVVRERLETLYPALKNLTETQVARLMAAAEKTESLEEATLSGWKRHGSQMLDQVTAAITKQFEIGRAHV